MKNKKEQKANEQVVEKNETPNEEKNPNYYEIVRNESDSDFLDAVEAKRKEVNKKYVTTRRTNNIIMAVVVVIFVAAFILIAQGTWGQITGWVLVGTSVVGMVIYYVLSRRKYPDMSKKYCVDFWKLSNNFLFGHEPFTNCHIDFAEKYNLAEVAADRVYKDIIEIASRNIVRGKYNGKDFAFGELAFYKAGAKKRSREVMFVGRHLCLENHLPIDGRFLITMKCEKNLDLPNDIEDLVPLFEEGDFIIYGSEGADYEKALGKDLISQLKRIKVTGALVNVNIVFWHKRTACYLSYDDSIVAIPFNSEINRQSYYDLRQNINDLFDILAK